METKKKKTVVFAPVLEETQKKETPITKTNEIEDVLLILNPVYEDIYTLIPEYLEGLGFKVINYNTITFTEKQIKRIISKRYKNSSYKKEIMMHFTEEKSAFFHAAKMNGNKFVDELMRKYFTSWPEVFEFKLLEKPLKTEVFPFLLVPMDSAQMHEDALQIISPGLLSYWGQDVYKFSKNNLDKLLNTIMISTIGDNVMMEKGMSNYMTRQLYYNPKESKSIHFVTHTPKQGMFEVRIQNKYGSLNSRSAIEKKRNRLLSKFHCLSMYYIQL